MTAEEWDDIETYPAREPEPMPEPDWPPVARRCRDLDCRTCYPKGADT